MSLILIQESVQIIAEAVKALLNVDVTIADNQLIRIAATGNYKKLIGEKMPKGCLFEKIIEDRRHDMVVRATEVDGCENCQSKEVCLEKATIGYPIISEDKLYGVIGFIAFDDEQKKKLKDENEQILGFLKSLGDLIARSIGYEKVIGTYKILTAELNEIIDSISRGIICVDEFGFIKYSNKIFRTLLKCDEENLAGYHIKTIFKNIEFKEDIYNIPFETKLNIDDELKSFIVKISPSMVKGEIKSYIIELNKTGTMVMDAINILERDNSKGFDSILGNSSKAKEVVELAKQVAKSKSTVMIRGASGTGKELFARAIHNSSKRKDKPFIAINCSSIPQELFESELFGYDSGAFTGASKGGKIGKFELANGGTLFLDEIGDLPIHMQPKLLRVLQDESFVRVGGKENISVDFRLIAATNRDLEEMMKDGSFREDLYYRLNVIPLNIPSLRERRDDIPLMLDYKLKEFCKRLGKDEMHFSKDVINLFMNYSWPGNVRELENVVEYLVNISDGEVIDIDTLSENMINKMSVEDKDYTNMSLKDRLDLEEKKILEDFIKKYGDSREAKDIIAEKLDMNLSTLYRKLNKHKL